jgi:hypothetical protein
MLRSSMSRPKISYVLGHLGKSPIRVEARRSGFTGFAYALLYVMSLIVGTTCPRSTSANHVDTDGCPDIEVNGGESLTPEVIDYYTGEFYPDGSIVPPRTRVHLHAVATAYGSCQLIHYSYPESCINGNY